MKMSRSEQWGHLASHLECDDGDYEHKEDTEPEPPRRRTKARHRVNLFIEAESSVDWDASNDEESDNNNDDLDGFILVWRQRYQTSAKVHTVPRLSFVVRAVDIVTTAHPELECSRFFSRPINTRLPAPLASLDIIDHYLFFVSSFSCVLCL